MTENEGYQPEKFPKTRTIPEGWSFMDSYENSSAVENHLETPKMETFPKTATFPEFWDLSQLDE